MPIAPCAVFLYSSGMLLNIMERFGNIFDAVQRAVEAPRTQSRLFGIIFCVFILTLAGAEAKRLGLLPPPLNAWAPNGHFDAVNLAFTLLLVLELLGLVFAISCSLSRALAKQFKILALILLRNAFKELAHLHEPINILTDWQTVCNIGILGAGALAVFICLNLYRRVAQPSAQMSGEVRMRYVLAKKTLGLALLIIFVVIGLRDLRLVALTGKSGFFENIYTTLIFADVALVLIAQRYVLNFHFTFRNAGFVLATLLIRISLGTPAPWDALIGLSAALYALALAWAVTRFDPRTLPPRPNRPEKTG